MKGRLIDINLYVTYTILQPTRLFSWYACLLPKESKWSKWRAVISLTLTLVTIDVDYIYFFR